MNKLESFEQFLTTQSVDISVGGFLLNLSLTALLTFILGLIYMRYAKSLSNRKRFGRNFVLLGVTTMIIITIVKSSLALSLGLVGALSIVRFRAAIKEPEELAYIFLTIAVGLGFGADQRLITLVGFVFLAALVVGFGFLKKKEENQNLLLTVSSPGGQNGLLEGVVNILRQHCDEVSLTRVDENSQLMEAAFWVEFQDFQALSNAKGALKELDPTIAISLLDQKGLG